MNTHPPMRPLSARYCRQTKSDDIWRNPHTCGQPANHEDDHTCRCGTTWPPEEEPEP